MNNLNHFLIRNDLSETAILKIEPEGSLVGLECGDEVEVVDEFDSEPVTVTLGKLTDGRSLLSIWPGDGEVRVERDGVNVLDLKSPPLA